MTNAALSQSDYRIQATDIRQAIALGKKLIGKLTAQLTVLDAAGIPDSQPWISFKRVTDVRQLASPHRTLRAALRADIDALRKEIASLRAEAKTLRAQMRIQRIRAARRRAVKADHDFRAHARRLLKEAEKRGHVTEAEMAILVGEAEGVARHWIGVVDAAPTRENMKRTLLSVEPLMLFGDDDAYPPSAPRRLRPEKTYRTKPGDTLSGISKRFYGKPGYWDIIYLANTRALTTVRAIPPGVSLRIP